MTGFLAGQENGNRDRWTRKKSAAGLQPSVSHPTILAPNEVSEAWSRSQNQTGAHYLTPSSGGCAAPPRVRTSTRAHTRNRRHYHYRHCDPFEPPRIREPALREIGHAALRLGGEGDTAFPFATLEGRMLGVDAGGAIRRDAASRCGEVRASVTAVEGVVAVNLRRARPSSARDTCVNCSRGAG